MPIAALFDINLDGDDAGFEATNGQSLSLRLRDPSLASTVLFQVYDPSGPNPALGIAANPPRASKGAPTLTLVGATSGQAVSPVSVNGAVTVSMPVSGGHSWIFRCVVNGGLRSLPNGSTVVEPSFVFERGVFIPTSYGLRKTVATEVQHFEPEGWAGALCDLFDQGAAPVSMFTPPGLGGVARTVSSRLTEEILCTDFMSDAEKADCFAGTRLFDLQPACQRAVDYALYKNGFFAAPGPRVRLPAGVLRFDRTLHVGYGADFRSIELVGDGMRFGTNLEYGSGTAIIANFVNAPAINVQGGRNVILRGFSLEGQNDAALAMVVGLSASSLSVGNWIDEGCSSSRYAPYAGICIDGWSGTRPGVSYPDVPYPDWYVDEHELNIGPLTQYGKGASSNTRIEDVDIRRFVVGVVQQPCDYDGNGDYTKLQNVLILWCAYAFSWGNSQSRVLTFLDCSFVGIHTSFSTGKFGRQIGEPQFTVISCDFSQNIQWMDIDTLGYGAGPMFIGCFGEANYRLGKIVGAGSSGTARFIGGEYGFSWWEQLGCPTWLLEIYATHVIFFEGVTFYITAEGMANFRCQGQAGPAENHIEAARCLRFKDIAMAVYQAPYELYQKCAFNATMGLFMSFGSTTVQLPYSCRTEKIHNLDTGDPVGPLLYDDFMQGPRSRCLPVYARRAKALVRGNDPGIPVAWKIPQNLSISGMTIVGRNITFTVTGATAASLAHGGGDVGDCLFCDGSGALFFVKSRTGTSITARCMAGFNGAGNLLNGLDNGSIIYALNCRRYTPIEVLYGNITSGSPTITGIVKGDGSAPNLTAHFVVGDFIYVDDDVDRFIAPADITLTAMDNTAKTMTFAGNFLFTRTRMRLGIFVRAAMPNAA